MEKKPIKYYSTNGQSAEVTFREALLKGLASDGGLFMPDSFPQLTKEELENFSGKDYHEIAFFILNMFIGNEIDQEELFKLCKDAYNFEVPLEKVTDHKFILRLDRGPTASFKDFAARMMSRLMQHFLYIDNKFLTILTATSGDTGSAVANAFYGLENINVIILYPKDEVSVMQRKQMTTLKKNIRVIAVNGKFDDCQYMVKKAFLDPSLKHIPLSSANSINIGRLLPQAVYYFYAWSRLAKEADVKAIFSVPSGNFGNLTAGLVASRMGLPVEKFIVTTNDNNEVPEFLRTGSYSPVCPSINCLSSAMNVGHPSNLARMIALYGGVMSETGEIKKEPDMDSLCRDLYGVSISDDVTRTSIAEIYRDFNIILEPHGAIAWQGINEYLKNGNNKSPEEQLFVSLETAHPAKFPDEIRQVLNLDPPLPISLSELSEKEEKFLLMENNYSLLKELILKTINKE